MHVVVDEHDGAPARDPLDQRDGAVDVLDAHAGGRLVEQQQPRVQRQRQGQLQGPLLPVRERAGEHPGPVGQADLVEQVHGAWAELAHLLLGAPEPVAEPGRRGQRELDVVDEGHLVEQAGDLERAGHAQVDDLLRAEPGDVAVAEVDRARRGRQEAGEQVEQGGLAGAVRPDQGVHAALGDVEVDPLDGGEAAELLGQCPGAQQRGRGRRALRHGCGLRAALHGLPPRWSGDVSGVEQRPTLGADGGSEGVAARHSV